MLFSRRISFDFGLRRGTRRLSPLRFAAVALPLAALGFGGCAQNPQQLAAASSHGKEYFPSSIYGRASRRVVADGQPIPRGGGQYLVGKPYIVAGQTYYPSERRIVQVGNASWYGDAFHGRLTANGEIYDRDSFSAAHPTMPLPSYARVTNLRNNYSMIVRVNDRGPYASNRIMDVSRRVAEALDFKRHGTAAVKVEYVGRASLAGSDDGRLYATLRTDSPAPWRSNEPTMVAEEQPRARVASLAPYVPARARPVLAETPEERVSARNERLAATAMPARDLGDRRSPAYTRRELPPETFARRDAAREGTRMPAPLVARHEGTNRSIQFAYRGEVAHLPIRALLLPPSGRAPRAEPVRMAMAPRRAPVLPPTRPMDLGTIPGADSQIGSRHASLRMARSHDD